MEKFFEKTEDFIADDSFLLWCKKTDSNAVTAWDQWILNNPEKQEFVDNAVQILEHVQIQDRAIDAEQAAAAENRLRQAIESERHTIRAKVVKIRSGGIRWVAAAAIAIAFFAIGIKYMQRDSSAPYMASEYGQIKQEKLPDGTVVTLNANSKITVPKKWKAGTEREVWLSGEAFFHVKKTATKDKFIVHTDAFDIEVTGTSFNVINRNGKSSITLKEGSVKIHRKGEAELIMKPGDYVEFAEKQMQLKTANKLDYMAWTDNKLIFENTSLKELATIINDHYGVEVLLDGNGLAEKTVTGIMPNDSLEILLQSLEATQDFTIRQLKNTITITAKLQN